MSARIGNVIGGIAGGVVGTMIKKIMISIGAGIAMCVFLDLMLTWTRDEVFSLTPDAYESGFLTKTSVALTMSIIPYMVYLALFVFMLAPTLMMFFFSGFQKWTWIFPWDPPNFIEDSLDIIAFFLNMF